MNTHIVNLANLDVQPVSPARAPKGLNDSGKFGAFVDNTPDMSDVPARFRHIGRREDAGDYWQGE